MQKLRGSVGCTLEAIKEGVQAWPICCFLIRAAQECLFTVIKWEHKGSSASAGGILLTSSTAAKSFCGHTQLLISSWINAWDWEVFWLMQTVQQTAIVLASYNHWSITHALIQVSHPRLSFLRTSAAGITQQTWVRSSCGMRLLCQKLLAILS